MYKKYFKPFPVIKTDRLTIKKITLKDIKEVFAVYNDYDVCKFSDVYRHETIIDSFWYIIDLKEKYLKNKLFTFGVYYNEKLIGTISVTEILKDCTEAQIGYSFNPKYRLQGFGSEAVKGFTEFLFNSLPMKKITAFTMLNNEASKKLLTKIGFSYMKTFYDMGLYHGKKIDVDGFELLKKS